MSQAAERWDLSYTQNRELSWLAFDQRVLEEAADPSVPLMERLRFLSIFTSNLDEFFMVRVGSLTDLALVAPDSRENKGGLSPAEQLQRIYAAVGPLTERRDQVYREVMEALGRHGVADVPYKELKNGEREYVRGWYRDTMRPLLTAQIIDPSHPFPHLKNKALYAAAVLRDGEKRRLGIVGVPEVVPPIVTLPGRPGAFVRTEDILAHHLRKIFKIYQVEEQAVVSVTRNADISYDEAMDQEDLDLRAQMTKLLRRRERLAPVRLEMQGEAPALREILLQRLKLTPEQSDMCACPLALTYAYQLDSPDAGLFYPPHAPAYPAWLNRETPVWDQVQRRDVLLFYPYHSMQPFLDLLRQSARDPEVVSIQMTIYRVASKSAVVKDLCLAAENGKAVTVLVELRARFDEGNNITWARELEEAGCRVIYGPAGYKCHGKICLITRRDKSGLSYVTQIGTGNYNEKTAALYTDFSLMTADPVIAEDAVAFFQNMLIGNLNGAYENLLVAPATMKRTIIKCIDEQIAKGPEGRITIKANSVTEREIIDKLAEASQAGVQIRMNIRGICCLLPGIEGKTDNVHVRSIVGQFLEHSRIFCFGAGDDVKMYISSADLMTRNLVHRVEVAAPIYDDSIKASILLFLDKIFADTLKARTLQPDGLYVPVSEGRDAALHEGEPPFCMHDWCVEHPLQQFTTEKPKVGKHAKVRTAAPREKAKAQPQAEPVQQQAAPEERKSGWQKFKSLFGGK